MWGVTLDPSAPDVNPLTPNFERDPGSALDIAAQLSPLLQGRVDAGTTARAMYSTDASNYRHVPLEVVTLLPHADASADSEGAGPPRDAAGVCLGLEEAARRPEGVSVRVSC